MSRRLINISRLNLEFINCRFRGINQLNEETMFSRFRIYQSIRSCEFIDCKFEIISQLTLGNCEF